MRMYVRADNSDSDSRINALGTLLRDANLNTRNAK